MQPCFEPWAHFAVKYCRNAVEVTEDRWRPKEISSHKI
jgi:hypothetical protein